MKEVHLVKWSSGMYDDYTVDNLETVFLSLSSAEKAKEEIENVEPFPFDFCDEETFVKLLYAGKLTTEDINKYDEWRAEKHRKSNFNCAWIEILTVTE